MLTKFLLCRQKRTGLAQLAPYQLIVQYEGKLFFLGDLNRNTTYCKLCRSVSLETGDVADGVASFCPIFLCKFPLQQRGV